MKALRRPARSSRGLAIGLGIAFFASICGLANIVFEAVQKIRDGKGLETYRTTWLVEFSWIGILFSLGSTVLVVGVAAIYAWWRNRRDWQELEKNSRPNARNS
jgi:hypothetical protein